MEQTAFDHLENGHFLTHLRQNPTFYPTLWVKRRLPPNRIALEQREIRIERISREESKMRF